MPEKDGLHEMMAFGTAFSGAGLFWMGKRRQGASESPLPASLPRSSKTGIGSVFQ